LTFGFQLHLPQQGEDLGHFHKDTIDVHVLELFG
jgi:hypothetical protein